MNPQANRFKRPRLRKNKSQRGQAMVEYALVTAFVFGGLFVLGSLMWPNLVRAYQLYYRSFYAILNLPIP